MSELPIHCLVVSSRAASGAPALVADAHALGVTNLLDIEKHDLYFLLGELEPKQLERLAHELLTDPVTQKYVWRSGTHTDGGTALEVAFRPGVTDPVAQEIVRAAHALGLTAVEQAATGQRYTVRGRDNVPLTQDEMHVLARRLLANDVIQRYALGEIEPAFPQDAHASGLVETIALTELSDDELLELSRERRAALDLNEMRAVQNYYRSVGREATDVEFEMIAQTWSEHCVHKTFKAEITYAGKRTADDGQQTADREPLVSSLQSPIPSLQSPVSRLQSSCDNQRNLKDLPPRGDRTNQRALGALGVCRQCGHFGF